MICIDVKRKDSEIIGFHVEGHAGYADSGYDIVCASVSVLVINCINSIDRYTTGHIDLKQDEASGMIDFTVDSQDDMVELLLKSLLLGLTQIALDYSDYITLH